MSQLLYPAPSGLHRSLPFGFLLSHLQAKLPDRLKPNLAHIYARQDMGNIGSKQGQ